MATVLLTYDVKKTSPTIHVELKDILVQRYGYSAKIRSRDGKEYDLPNTTLQKQGTTSQQSSMDFKAACKDVGATWEKYISSEYTTMGITVDNQ